MRATVRVGLIGLLFTCFNQSTFAAATEQQSYFWRHPEEISRIQRHEATALVWLAQTLKESIEARRDTPHQLTQVANGISAAMQRDLKILEDKVKAGKEFDESDRQESFWANPDLYKWVFRALEALEPRYINNRSYIEQALMGHAFAKLWADKGAQGYEKIVWLFQDDFYYWCLVMKNSEWWKNAEVVAGFKKILESKPTKSRAVMYLDPQERLFPAFSSDGAVDHPDAIEMIKLGKAMAPTFNDTGLVSGNFRWAQVDAYRQYVYEHSKVNRFVPFIAGVSRFFYSARHFGYYWGYQYTLHAPDIYPSEGWQKVYDTLLAKLAADADAAYAKGDYSAWVELGEAALGPICSLGDCEYTKFDPAQNKYVRSEEYVLEKSSRDWLRQLQTRVSTEENPKAQADIVKSEFKNIVERGINRIIQVFGDPRRALPQYREMGCAAYMVDMMTLARAGGLERIPLTFPLRLKR